MCNSIIPSLGENVSRDTAIETNYNKTLSLIENYIITIIF